MHRVLFICNHNSARSQMAEAYLNALGQGRFTTESAGLEPGVINPLVVEAMAEEGIDLSTKSTQSVFDLFRRGELFDYVITVCSESEEEKCPVFPGATHRLHMPFADPASFTGSKDERLAQVREVRGKIKEMIGDFIEWVESGHDQKRLGDYWVIR